MKKAGIPVLVWLVLVLYSVLFGVPTGLTQSAWWYFSHFAAVIIGLILEPIPAAAIGMIGVAFAAAMRYVNADITQSVNWALSGFSDSTVWLILAPCVLDGLQQDRVGAPHCPCPGQVAGRSNASVWVTRSRFPTSRSRGNPLQHRAQRRHDLSDHSQHSRAVWIRAEQSDLAPHWQLRDVDGHFATTAVTSPCSSLGWRERRRAYDREEHGKNRHQLVQWFLGFLPVGIVLLLLVPLLVYLVYPTRSQSQQRNSRWARKELVRWQDLAARDHHDCLDVISTIAMGLRRHPLFFAALPWLQLYQRDDGGAVSIALISSLTSLPGTRSWRTRAAGTCSCGFATLVTLANGLNQVGFVKWFADLASAPLKGLDP